MTAKGKSPPEPGRRGITIEIGRKRAEKSKFFVDTVNKELMEMGRFIMDTVSFHKTDVTDGQFSQPIHKKRYPLSLVWNKND